MKKTPNTLDQREKIIYRIRLTILIFLVIIFLISIVGFGYFTGDKLRDIDLTKTEKYLFGVGNFGNAPDEFVNSEEYYSKNKISTFVGQNLSQEEIAYMIYRYACLTYATTSQKSWHLYAEGKINALDSTGDLLASGYRYEKRRENTYLADTVLQNVNILSNVQGDAFGVAAINIAKSLVQYGEQRVYSKDYDYLRVADKDSFYVDSTYDIASASFTSKATKYNNKTHVEAKKKKGYVYREYDESFYDEYGLSSPEKTDHIINVESIVDDSVSITQKKDKYSNKYYEVSFDIDCDTILSSGTTATYYFEQFMINHLDLYDGSFSMFDIDIKYDKLKITMEVWDSGYFRSWRTDEVWTVWAELFKIRIPATTTITSLEYFSYDEKDNRFDELIISFTNDGNFVEFVD